MENTQDSATFTYGDVPLSLEQLSKLCFGTLSDAEREALVELTGGELEAVVGGMYGSGRRQGEPRSPPRPRR